MKILIYGPGVIGSLYAVLFSTAGFDITVYARGNRLNELRQNGLQYSQKGKINTADVKIIDKLEDNDRYQFIFLTVRSEHLNEALLELKTNKSRNIITMVNTLEPYENLENICGRNRIIPAFPGAGGSIDNGILDASLTPWIIQPTTFGEINGRKTKRTTTLAKILRKSHIPYQIVSNMHNWQISHLGMVVPIADAYYMSSSPADVYKDNSIMNKTSRRMKSNFKKLSKHHILSPYKFNLLMMCPQPILSFGLKLVYKSNFGEKFMYKHSMKAPEEMRRLHKEFYTYMKKNF